jgi:hypothetical protein
MNRVLLTALIVFLSYYSFFAASCTKNVTTTNYDTVTVVNRDTVINKDTVYITNSKNPIIGQWVGSYFVTGDAVDSFWYELDILADGIVYNGGNGTGGGSAYASGPWTLNGTSFSASLTIMAGVQPELLQTITATYDSVSGTLYNGHITDLNGNNYATGTFTIKRVQ